MKKTLEENAVRTLTEKQQCFVAAYNGDAVLAAAAAGYTPATVARIGRSMPHKAHIADALRRKAACEASAQAVSPMPAGRAVQPVSAQASTSAGLCRAPVSSTASRSSRPSKPQSPTSAEPVVTQQAASAVSSTAGALRKDAVEHPSAPAICSEAAGAACSEIPPDAQPEAAFDAVVSRRARQVFWTQVMNDPENSMRERLKASELLSKSEGEQRDRVEVSGKLDLPRAIAKGRERLGR